MGNTEPISDTTSEVSEPSRNRPWQFSLGMLLIVMTLAAVVAAAFSWDQLTGIWVYLGCFSLFMIAWRMRAGTFARSGHFASVAMISIAIGGASAIAFTATCAVPTTGYVLYGLDRGLFHETTAATQITAGCILVFSMLLGTAAALLIYWFTWPRKKGTANRSDIPEN